MKRVFLALSVATAVMMSGCEEETVDKGATKSATTGETVVKTEAVKGLPTIDKPLETEKERFSFVAGYNIGAQMKSVNDEIDREILVASIIEAMDGKEPRLTVDEAKLVQSKVYGRLQEQEKARQLEKLEKGKARVEEGKKFLTHNKTQPGVVVTESGLQYKVIKEAKGPNPTIDDKVEVHYVGTLVDGTEFDSSVKRGQTAKFPLRGVIKGWQEGIPLMNVGSKVKFFIPSELAYGKNPNPNGLITPDEMLIFEVELISIVEDPAKKKAEEAKKDADKPAEK